MTVALEDLAAAAEATVAAGRWWRVVLRNGTEALGAVLRRHQGGFRVLHMAVCEVLFVEPEDVERLEPIDDEQARALLRRVQSRECCKRRPRGPRDARAPVLPRGRAARRSPRRAALVSEVVRLRSEGLTLIEIRRATGLALSTVHNWLQAS